MSGRQWLFCHPQVYHLGLLKNMLPAWMLYILTLPPHTLKQPLNLRAISPQFLSECQEIFYLFIFKVFFPHFLNTWGSWQQQRASGFVSCVEVHSQLCWGQPLEDCWDSVLTHTFTAGALTSRKPLCTLIHTWKCWWLGRMHTLPFKAVSALVVFESVSEPGSPCKVSVSK